MPQTHNAEAAAAVVGRCEPCCRLDAHTRAFLGVLAVLGLLFAAWKTWPALENSATSSAPQVQSTLSSTPLNAFWDQPTALIPLPVTSSAEPAVGIGQPGVVKPAISWTPAGAPLLTTVVQSAPASHSPVSAVAPGSLAAPATNAASRVIRVEACQVTLVDQVQIAARQAGVLQDLHIREGLLVRPGQLLGQLEDASLRAARERAQVEWEIADEKATNDVNVRFSRKALQVAEAELKRVRTSIERYPNSISQTELERLQLIAEKSGLEIEQSEREIKVNAMTKKLKAVELSTAEIELEQRKIVSPLEGMVVQIYKRAGEWVNPGDPVARVVRLNRLRIECYLDAKQHGAELVDRPVVFRAQTPGYTEPQAFPGRVVFVSPEVEAVSGQIRIWAEVDNPRLTLRPGVQGVLSIEPASPDAAN